MVTIFTASFIMSTIEIQTTQNVTIEYELATLRDRFFAFFIDVVIYLVIYFLANMFLLTLLGSVLTDWGEHFLGLMIVVGFLAYHLVSEVFANGQSWGKKAMGLRVVRLDGHEAGLGDYLLRTVFLLVDFVLSAGILAALLIGSTFKNQRLGDLAANTSIIRIKNHLHFYLDDIMKIQTIEHYEPQFRAVRQLKEADVLLIKNLLARHQNWPNEAHEKAIAETTEVICSTLGIPFPKSNKIEFLKTLIRDYIVLTR